MKNPWSKTVEYRTWKNMINRCKPGDKDHTYFYDKGIKVHDSWLGPRGFLNFFKCVGKKPSGTVLSRSDKTGDYGPGNVSWTTFKEFNLGRSTYTKHATHFSDTCLIEELNRRGYHITE